MLSERLFCRPLRWLARKIPSRSPGVPIKILLAVACGMIYCFGITGSTLLLLKFAAAEKRRKLVRYARREKVR